MNTPDFSQLETLQPRGTQPYTLYSVKGEPTLTVLSATDANEGYFNVALKRTAKKIGRRVRRTGVSRKVIDENRDEDRELYAKHIVQGWEGVRDADGVEVPCSREACAEFLRKLPDWLFDDLRTFCSDPINFLVDDDPDDDDIEETAGN